MTTPFDKTLPSPVQRAASPAPPAVSVPHSPPATRLPRLLPAGTDGKPAREPESLAAHQARHGVLPYRGGSGRLITGFQAAGLTGRGGAAFPAHRKLQATFDAARKSRRLPVVIANGAESEPVSDKDATLLWLAPHLVLDGLQLAAEAVGAERAVLYVKFPGGRPPVDPRQRGETPLSPPSPGERAKPARPRDLPPTGLGSTTARSRDLPATGLGSSSALPGDPPGTGLGTPPSPGDALRNALAERRAAGVDRIPVELAGAPPRFLAGQETALVSHLGGGSARPTFTPPRPTERGLGGAPTLVSNVETLAHMALIARHGPDWFRSVGTVAQPGSMLCTVRRADGVPRILETAIGAPLRDLLGPVSDRAAVLIGGYHGTWVPAATAATLTLDDASLSAVGARVGAGVIITLPTDRCGLLETAVCVRYLALESAGQCGPCLNGLPRIAAALAELAGGRPRRGVRSDLERWAGLVTGRGACHHPDGTVRLVRSALQVFAAEAALHERGQCSAPRHDRPFLPIPADIAHTEEDWR